jgi:glyoxalase family protein
MRNRLMENWGFQVTEVKDRNYFHSIYFRIPGQVLFEIATIPPGFLIDESFDQLGKELKLPAWEEVNRKHIEGVLPKIKV